MSTNELVETLAELRFLHDFSRPQLEELAKVASLRDFPDHTVVFREGELAKSIFLVVSGRVSLEICAPSIGCRRILTVGPGEILGWSALLDQPLLTATARTMAPTQLVELDAAALRKTCQSNSQFGYEFLRRTMLALTTRLEATRMQLIDVYGSQTPGTVSADED